jgi:hypothetical protein
MSHSIDILIPTYNRPAALAVTLTSLALQDCHDFRVIISDQSPETGIAEYGVIQAVSNVLGLHGTPVEIHRHLPKRGMAEQRWYLLSKAEAPYSLFLDDDVILEPYIVGMMLKVIKEEGCGFVGNAVIGLSYLDDERPHEQDIHFWEGPVKPEIITPGSIAWERYRLHNAANLYHVQQQFQASAQNPQKYKVAWVGGCVMYDTEKLREAGGYDFWKDLPEQHSGEDVIAQLQVMALFGGCGLIPSGAYHQELPTTVPNREIDAPKVLDLDKLLRTKSNGLQHTLKEQG